MARIGKIAFVLLVASFASPVVAQTPSEPKAATAPKTAKPTAPTVAPTAPTIAPKLPANAITPKTVAPVAPKPNVKLPAQPDVELDEVVRPNS